MGFAELYADRSLRSVLQQQSVFMTFEEGDTLLEDGSWVRYVPFVADGLIKVYTEDEFGNEMLLYYISPGESCILSATYCLRNTKSAVKAIVEEPASVVLVPSQLVPSIARNHPSWNAFFYGLFQQKYHELIHTIGLLTFRRKDNRLLDYLQKQAGLKETKTLHITHQQIADDLGTSREVISRLLKKLESEGKLQLEHRRIVLM